MHMRGSARIPLNAQPSDSSPPRGNPCQTALAGQSRPSCRPRQIHPRNIRVSLRLDQIVWETFLKYSTNHGQSWNEEDRIANAAIVRLAHKDHNAELLAFCQRRREELKSNDKSTRDRAQLDNLIKSLSKAPPPNP